MPSGCETYCISLIVAMVLMPYRTIIRIVFFSCRSAECIPLNFGTDCIGSKAGRQSFLVTAKAMIPRTAIIGKKINGMFMVPTRTKMTSSSQSMPIITRKKILIALSSILSHALTVRGMIKKQYFAHRKAKSDLNDSVVILDIRRERLVSDANRSERAILR